MRGDDDVDVRQHVSVLEPLTSGEDLEKHGERVSTSASYSLALAQAKLAQPKLVRPKLKSCRSRTVLLSSKQKREHFP